MRMRNVAVTLCAALLCGSVAAQAPSFFSEVVEVRVTNVDVIVTGRDGKPVTGLTRDDFELYEDGVLKKISNFFEMRGGPTALLAPVAGERPAAGAPVPGHADIRRRDITIFIDNAVLHPHRRNAILPHLDTFVGRNVRAGDTVSIAVWGNSLKIALEPTNEPAAIEAALKKLRTETTLSASSGQGIEEFHRSIELLIRAHAARGEKPPWMSGVSEARAFAMKASHALKQRVEALKSVIAWRRGADGRKILVLLTTALSPNPAEAPFLYLDATREDFANPGSTALSDAREFEFPTMVKDIAEAANGAGVTLYPIDAAGKDSGLPDGDIATNRRITNAGTIEQPTFKLTLSAIAAETGGVAMTGSDNWRLAFDTISNDLDTYYSLGYRSEEERRDRTRNIEVKLKNKKLAVRTRRGVIERSITSEMHDAVASNLFRPAAANDLSIRATAGAAASKEGDSIVVPVMITIPIEKLTLVPEGADLTGSFAIYTAFLRKDGAVSKVAQQPQSFRFPADSLKRRKELTVKMDVTADSSTNGLSVGVMDALSRMTGFASLRLGTVGEAVNR